DAVGGALLMELGCVFEDADDVPLDAEADGVIGCPSKSVDDVDPGTEVGCAPDEMVELVPGT
ncbi:hypothetical protein KC329_g10419, partial [Hortaea werneckii]